MNITAKSRYALKIMMDLAIKEGSSTRQDIAKRQGLSVDFMDHVISSLKADELIRTTRGRSGGLCLNREPSEISMWDIFSCVEDQIFSVMCATHEGCEIDSSCMSADVWKNIYRGIESQMRAQSLSRSNFRKVNSRYA